MLSGSVRICVECRLASTKALASGVGWLKCRRGTYHIRCSECLQEDYLKKSLSSFVDREGQAVKGVVRRRRLEGSLCRTCFEEEDRQGLAHKNRLQAEIEARIDYLEWMEDMEQGNSRASAPTKYIVENVL